MPCPALPCPALPALPCPAGRCLACYFPVAFAMPDLALHVLCPHHHALRTFEVDMTNTKEGTKKRLGEHHKFDLSTCRVSQTQKHGLLQL